MLKKFWTLVCVGLFVSIPIKADGYEVEINLTHETPNKESYDGRSDINSPLQAYYVVSTHNVIISFAYELGDVVVSIENLDTGNYVQEVISSNQGIAFLATPDDYGVHNSAIIDRYMRSRIVTQFDYEWVYNNTDPSVILPYVQPYSTYTYSSPVVVKYGLRWGLDPYTVYDSMWFVTDISEIWQIESLTYGSNSKIITNFEVL